MHSFIIHPKVEAALAEGSAVVALESTVITHGLPYPQNIETAVAMETAVRQGGATPATIAIIDGNVHIGLSDDQIDRLAQQDSRDVRKCSRKDIPIALARKEHGGTTVAGTMILAKVAKIPIFATGGIGGVHRGHPFDVSADLLELGQTAVTVVSSGAKSILDLPATREVLETQGVPILGFQSDTMPSFFSRSSGLSVDARLETAVEVARIIQHHHALGLQSGILVTVPVPEKDACEPELIETAVAQANAEANQLGIHGPAATPWLLQRVVQLTNGQSMKANQALLRNNGFVAAQIAKEVVKLTNNSH